MSIPTITTQIALYLSGVPISDPVFIHSLATALKARYCLLNHPTHLLPNFRLGIGYTQKKEKGEGLWRHGQRCRITANQKSFEKNVN